MTDDPNPAKGLFLAALKATNASDRAALLDRECADDPALRARVEGLLHAHESSDSLLDDPIVGPAAESLVGAVSTDGPAATDPQLGGGVRAANGAEVLSFLAPAREPGSLGRLDHYEILEIVGRGGMGLVLKARDTKLQRVVAVKVLAPLLASSETARRRFIREAQAAAAVRDEHVVAIHAVEDAGPIPYLVMEFVSGVTLDDLAKRGGPLAVAEILRIGMQAARGLAAAHAQGLIHRDVKPANILLENGVQRVKLTDFGLARAADDASITQSGLIAGTPLYMSPEQARGDRVSHRSDLFSLGSVLYTLAAGRPAFQAESMAAVMRKVCDDAPQPIKEANPNAPDWLEAVIGRLMAKEPAERIQSAAATADLLGQYLAFVQQPHAVPLPAAGPLAQAKRTTSYVRWIAAAAILAAAVGTIGIVALRSPKNDKRNSAAPAETAAVESAEERPRSPKTAPELAKLSSPFDGRKRTDIPQDLLALAGAGDPAAAPPELVAVLASPAFAMPHAGPTSWPATDRTGRLLAIPCGGDVAVFDTASGSIRQLLNGHVDRIYCVAFSPDGKRLAAGDWGPDLAIHVWDVDTGQLIFALTGHTKRVNRVVFSPDGSRLASVASDESLRVWNAGTGEPVFRAPGPPGDIYDVAYSPNGNWLATTGADGFLWVWDATNGTEVKKTQCHAPAARNQHSVAFSPDGAWLASGSETEVRILETKTWTEKCAIPSPGVWTAFSPDSQTLFAAATVAPPGQANIVTRWAVETGASQGAITLQSRGKWATYHLSLDGKALYSMRCDPAEPSLHAYDAATGAVMAPPQGQSPRVYAVAFSGDGRILASGNQDGTVRVWHLAKWQPGQPAPPYRILGLHADRVWDVALNPDSTRLATGSYDGTIGIWDVATGERLRTLTGHRPFASTVAFSPDGRTLAIGRTDGTVRLWDPATGDEAEPISGHGGHVIAIAYSPDGRLLASAGYRDRMVILLDAKTRKPLRTFHFGDREIGCIAFSPDSRTLAAGGSDGRVQMWDIESGQESALQGHSGLVEGLAFHPAGRRLATASDDGTVRFWDRTSPDPIRVIGPGPFGRMARRVAFSPDGRYLATANFNGTIAILRTPE